MSAVFVIYMVFFVVVLVFALIPLIFHIWALVDISQTPDEVFGPPWDNMKQQWVIGLLVAFFIPVGHIVGPILWWTQVRGRVKQGLPPERPFWAPKPQAPYPPQVPYQQAPPYPQQPPQPPPNG